jgi:PAS domain-containing protein
MPIPDGARAQSGVSRVILRIYRSVLRPGMEPELLARLRSRMPRLHDAGAPSDFTYGFRHESGTTIFLAVSAWPSFDSLVDATGGDLREPIQIMAMGELVTSNRVETFEQLPPICRRLDLVGGRVLGVVTAMVAPGRESFAQEKIDAGAEAALAAGAVAAHVGRRVQDDRTFVTCVVVWPARSTMAAFLRSRDLPMMDPSVARGLSTWRFETYTALAPERLLVPPAGPAVLVVDDEGHVADTTSGLEAVLGIPGELLVGRSLLDLASDASGRADLTHRFLKTRIGHGTVELVRPDGRRASVRYRSMADVPAPGLRAAVLTLPDQPEDLRPTAAIVNEALGDWSCSAAPPDKAGSVA